MGYFVLGYGVFWILFFSYVYKMEKSFQRIKQEIDQLKANQKAT